MLCLSGARLAPACGDELVGDSGGGAAACAACAADTDDEVELPAKSSEARCRRLGGEPTSPMAAVVLAPTNGQLAARRHGSAVERRGEERRGEVQRVDEEYEEYDDSSSSSSSSSSEARSE